MVSYQIVTDATADLPAALARECSITVIPMEVHLGDEDAVYAYEPEWKQLSPAVFYQRVREGATSTTTQINVFAYRCAFEPILQSGQDIIYFAFSSALTGSQQSALIAANELLEEYPGRRISIVDTLSASLGEGLFVYHAAKKREEGLSFDELVAWAERTRQNHCHWFTVDDLNHLKKGGRVSSAAAAFGTALRIKPVLEVNYQGRLIPAFKVQGRKHSLKKLVELMETTFQPEQSDVVFIGHGDCLEDAQFVNKLVKERFGVEALVVDFIGPIVGTHAGPGTVALFYYGERKPC